MHNSRYVKVESFGCENPVVRYRCKYCGFVTDLRITLHDHTWRYHLSRDYCTNDSKQETYSCNNCDFTSYSLLVRFAHEGAHFKLRYKSKNLGNLKRALNSHKHNCSQCSFQTRYTKSLKAHIVNRHTDPREIKWFECEQCQYKARNRSYLRNHIKARHNPEKQLQCRHCSYRTAFKTDLKKHVIRRHTDPEEGEWLKCEQCEYKARCKDTLQRHIKMKHRPKNIMQCRHGPYSSAHKHNLETHILRHHTDPAEIEWLECEQCEYKARNRRYLRSHINVRHNEKSLQCRHCSYKTALKTDLKRHVIRRHTDPHEVEWFECEQCEYKARCKDTLQRHIKMKHHPRNIMHCSHCPYRSAHKHNLETHILRHHTDPTEIKWFTCDQCDYRSILKFCLNQHIKRVHINGNQV